MPKVFIFSDQFYTTHPYLEIPLYNEIKDRGVDVVFVLVENDIRLTDQILSEEYNKLNIVSIKKNKNLGSLFGKEDILVMRWVHKLGGAEAASSVITKNKVIMYDVPGVDVAFRQAPAQYLAIKGNDLLKKVEKSFRYKKIFVTGLLHGDSVISTEVDRDLFVESYGIDRSKKLALITPANPGEAYMSGLKEDYSSIVKIVRDLCPSYEIAVKAHPNDYTAKIPAQPGITHKSQHYNGKCSWEIFAPGIKVIKADEGYKSIKACDVILNIRSSLAMELSLFKKPLININRKKYVTNWVFDPKCMMDIDISDLANVLNKNEYKSNVEEWEEYTKKHMHSSDGRAYVRIADMAIKALRGKI